VRCSYLERKNSITKIQAHARGTVVRSKHKKRKMRPVRDAPPPPQPSAEDEERQRLMKVKQLFEAELINEAKRRMIEANEKQREKATKVLRESQLKQMKIHKANRQLRTLLETNERLRKRCEVASAKLDANIHLAEKQQTNLKQTANRGETEHSAEDIKENQALDLQLDALRKQADYFMRENRTLRAKADVAISTTTASAARKAINHGAALQAHLDLLKKEKKALETVVHGAQHKAASEIEIEVSERLAQEQDIKARIKAANDSLRELQIQALEKRSSSKANHSQKPDIAIIHELKKENRELELQVRALRGQMHPVSRSKPKKPAALEPKARNLVECKAKRARESAKLEKCHNMLMHEKKVSVSIMKRKVEILQERSDSLVEEKHKLHRILFNLEARLKNAFEYRQDLQETNQALNTTRT